jgi:hypothetical protein
MKQVALRFVAAAGVALTTFAVSQSASAQGFVGPDDTDSGTEAPKLSTRSIKLFDQFRSTTSIELSVGPIWARRVQDDTPITLRRNFTRGAPLASEIAFGSIYTTPSQRGPFYLTGHLKTLLRVIDDKSFSWSVFHQEFGGGLMLGPLEPEVRIRLSILSADIIHAEPSVQFFTPGVSAGVGIHMGKFRLDIKAHSEYLWRWFGPDYLIRGVTIGLRLDQPRPKSPFEETRSP